MANPQTNKMNKTTYNSFAGSKFKSQNENNVENFIEQHNNQIVLFYVIYSIKFFIGRGRRRFYDEFTIPNKK